MIDIHTHILPGMDDGSRDIKESIKLIETLQMQGVSSVVLTPHFYPHRESLDQFISRRAKAYELIKEIDTDMDLVLGSETFLTENLLWNDHIDELCIGQTDFILLELPFTKEWTARTYRQIEGLMSKFGVRPIIAHIERYDAMKKKSEQESILNRLSDMGCLFQLDTDSITDFRTRHSMLKLIKAGWIDFAGSDCHDMKTRAPQFDQFNAIIRKRLGQEYLDRFEKNANSILNQ